MRNTQLMQADADRGITAATSSRFQRLFGWYARHYLRKHLHALRGRIPALPAIDSDVPVIVYLNHASWWDPLVAIIVAREFFPNRLHYAPIDAEGLSKYRFLSRIGFFGIEPGTVRGARRFLGTASTVCSSPSAALWLTPQGRFADPRERPVRLEPGLGHLLCRLDRAFVLPLAVEYPFWEERTAEALALAGRPLTVDTNERHTAEQWNTRLAELLEAAQDELAALSRARDSGSFKTIVAGRAGVGAIYDFWRAAKSFLRGQRFQRSHGDIS
jgi:1-acyl-sn-glycerol-3-phosphate acyltransferase